jgi:hypothetical protein
LQTTDSSPPPSLARSTGQDLTAEDAKACIIGDRDHV